ncbi:MAG: S1 family peptidase [Rubrivivax sp.]|nr:S1 family peptidase [Rubrivivax sp.]
MAAITGQQEAVSADQVAKAHTRASIAARALLGTAADTMNPDELEAQLADRVPGFAGWVHREDGSSVMRMARRAAVASGAIGKGGAASTPERSVSADALSRAMETPVDVKTALFDSRQLLTFKNRAFALASIKGVIATSINRATNRVEVTYNQELAADAIEALAAQLAAAGIPKAALVLQPGELPRAVATVGTSVRSQPLPLAAGAQFNFSTTEGTFVCSVGVPATRAGVLGFVTASHCSQQVYSVNAGTTMTAPNGTFVGSETVDPAGFSCSLPDTLGCREGDALFVSGGPANAVDFGRVLITGTRSLIVNGTIPVQGSLAYPTVGQTVYKTGRTTGTRSGRVARVCVNALVGDGAGNTYGALCSVELNSTTFIAGGDSGSSVWLYDGTGAVINGIVSYGSSTTGGYSPWGGVTKELGALTIR